MEAPLKPPDPPPLFSLGTVVVTPAARAALDRSHQCECEFLGRHQRGDWGGVDRDGEGLVNDAEASPEGRNQLNGYILSAYQTKLGDPLHVMTVWDTGVTTVSVPSESHSDAPDAPSKA